MKKTIIIIVTVLVVIAAVCTGLYFFTDVFNFLKPASDNFSTQAQKLVGTEDKSYSTYQESINKLKVDSYSGNMDLSMNMNVPSKYVSSSAQSLINSSKLKISGSYDANTKASSSNIGLSKDGKDVLSLSTVLDKQKVSITSKDLYDKYLTIDFSKYEDFCRANNIEVDEDTKNAIKTMTNLQNVDSSNLLYDLFYISEEDYNALDKKYGNLFTDLIDKEKYTTKKNQKVTVGGDEVKTTAYSLTMSGEDAYNFINKLVDLLKNDDTFKKLVKEKYGILQKYYNSVADASNSTSSEKLPDLTDSQITSLFSELTESLEEMEDDFKDIDQNIRLTIYSKSNEPVKFEVIVLDDEDDDEGTVIFTEELADGENTYTIDLEKISKLSETNNTSTTNSTYRNNSSLDAYSRNSLNSSISSSTSKLERTAGSLSKVIIKDKYEATDDSRKGKVTVSAKASGSDAKELLTVDYDTVDSKSEFKTDLNISCQGISLKLAYDVTGLDTDTQKVNFNISGKYSLYSVELTANGEVTRGKSDVPALTADNSVDVFTLSQEEFIKVYSEIVTKASDVLPDRLSSYGVKITKEQILSLLPTTPTTQTPATESVPTEAPAETPAA